MKARVPKDMNTYLHMSIHVNTRTNSHCTVGSVRLFDVYSENHCFSIFWKHHLGSYPPGFWNTKFKLVSSWRACLPFMESTFLLSLRSKIRTQLGRVVGASSPFWNTPDRQALHRSTQLCGLSEVSPVWGFQGVHRLTWKGWEVSGAFSSRIRPDHYLAALSDLPLALS